MLGFKIIFGAFICPIQTTLQKSMRLKFKLWLLTKNVRPRQDRQALHTVWGGNILGEYICIFWVVSSSLITVCAGTVCDIKTLLVKVLIFRVSRESCVRMCAIQSLNWRLGCKRDFIKECIKVKFNKKYWERLCPKMQRTFRSPWMNIRNTLVLHKFLWTMSTM